MLSLYEKSKSLSKERLDWLLYKIFVRLDSPDKESEFGWEINIVVSVSISRDSE